MVVLSNFRDVFNDSLEQKNISLPTIKQSFLKVDFEKNDVRLPKNTTIIYHGQEPTLPFAVGKAFDATICYWRRLAEESADCKTVYEVTLDVTASNFNFRPGDTIGVIPQNLDEEVDIIIDHLDLLSVVDLSYRISIISGQKGSKVPAHIPVCSTLRHVFKHCIDLRGVVKKLFLLTLSKYTKDKAEKKALEYLCSKEGASAYTTHILNRNLCILDLFEIFKTCKPPVEIILEHLPRLLPRPYSVMNSSLNSCNEIKFCFSVMDIGNGRKGLVTGWIERKINENSLESLVNNLSISNKNEKLVLNKIPIYMRKNINQFSFPESFTHPILLIGPGTGVAPYIGFLEERQWLDSKNVEQGPVWLFFGCRHPDLDYIYEEELGNFVSTGVLNKLTTAFSRVNSETKYVQDALLYHGQEVARLLKEGALVYVCGDVKTLSVQVKDVLVKCLIEFEDNTPEEAEKFVCDMQKGKRYLVDSWN